MRVIAGTLRGRQLRSIDSPGLRPTTDRVRESIFNILNSRITFNELIVLDLFAGTGALGIEALSRGAAHCDFVEMNGRAASTIQRNLNELGLRDRGTVLQRDALRHIVGTKQQYDLVFADPPYAATIFDRLVHDLFTLGRIRSGGFLVLEHSGFMQGRSTDVALLETTRHFGDTGVSVYQGKENK